MNRLSVDLREHWQRVYQTKAPSEVSWYQPEALASLRLIRSVAPEMAAPFAYHWMLRGAVPLVVTERTVDSPLSIDVEPDCAVIVAGTHDSVTVIVTGVLFAAPHAFDTMAK